MSYGDKPTAGPWTIDHEGNRIIGNDASGTIVCHLPGSMRNPSIAADARLIAAAPELLEALKGLQRERGCFCEMAIGHPLMTDHSNACKKAQAAIAKATAV